VALYGCPRGSLCSELDKQDSDLARACRELMRTPVVWMEQQLKAMGRRDARDLAFALLASYEGIALLANTFRDPELMIREGRRLERWIDSLARDSKVALTNADFRAARSALLFRVFEVEAAAAPPGNGCVGEVGAAQDG
jgi:hypothetical protein